MLIRRRFLKTSLVGMGTFLTGYIPVSRNRGKANVLLLGDSISIGYTPFVKELLQDQAMVYRPMNEKGRPENCAGTTNGINHIDRWIGETAWDVIHFNFGLHDLKHVDPITGKNSKNPNDPQQADLKTYRKNLRKIVKRLRATQAKLIFATTTPFPDYPSGPLRRADQPAIYNQVALTIMQKHNIIINDLHAFAVARLEDIQIPNNVHFTKTGSKELARQVADKITEVF